MFSCNALTFLTLFISATTADIFCEKGQILVRDKTFCNTSKLIPTDRIFFKCCPLDHAYDKLARSCIPVDQQKIVKNHTFLKIGIGDCKGVVKDYIVEQNTAELSSGVYCKDEVYKSREIVLRKCEKNTKQECRVNGVRCLRKCCPENEIFMHGAKCAVNLNVTFNYANWSDKIHVLKGFIPLSIDF